MPATFDKFFQTATNGQTPGDYQRRVIGDQSQISNSGFAMRKSPFPRTSRLIAIPTGLGQGFKRS